MKENVVLFGGSGTMGHAAFKEIWKRRDRYDLTLLLLPHKTEKRMFRPYEEMTGAVSIPGEGITQGNGLKIIWGDATHYADVEKAISGADWVLDAMAFISPEADYYPERCKAVNTDAVVNIVRAIEAQPGGAEHIRLIYTGTVAETGDRLGCIHMGRVGDPLKPSIFDTYAVTKIAGERAVLESNIRHWASLRMTYIMPSNFTEFAAMDDPILFHQPLDSRMENISDEDAGFGLANCLDIPDDSDFWQRVYNMAGGPQMRITPYELADRGFKMNGLSGLEACAERNWFALRNFHMQFYEDSHILNEYLHHWRETIDGYFEKIHHTTPAGLKLVAFMARRVTGFRKLVDRIAYNRFKNLAEQHRNGTLHWYKNRKDQRISAFYKDYATFEAIPGWGVDEPWAETPHNCSRLHHGYDESKTVLELADLHSAAQFRGGQVVTEDWNGDLHLPIDWRCAAGHSFSARPNTVLKAGHWCPDCAPPPWNFDEEARRNPFFAQVWYPNHDQEENNFYPADCIHDIAGADRDPIRL
jgi:nucleoside-diphosphate-sugar epimerase